MALGGPTRWAADAAPALNGLSADGWSIDRPSPNDANGTIPLTDRDFEAVTRPELGTKRSCAHCGAKFYDLNQSPITCPKCGTVFDVVQVSSRSRAEAARGPVRGLKPVGAETPEVLSVSREGAAAQGKKKPGEAIEGKDDVELDDEGLAFIEEREDTDVSEIISGDIENDKGT